MSFGAQTFDRLNTPILKENVINEIHNGLPTSSALFSIFSQNKTTVGGRYTREGVRTGRNLSPQFRPDMGPIPPPGRQDYANLQEVTREAYAGIQVSFKALAATKGDDEALADVLDGEIDGVIDDFANYVNVMGYLDGSGAIARVQGAPGAGGTTINVKQPGTAIIRALGGANLRLAFYNGQTARQSLAVGDIRANTGVVTVAGITSATAFTINAPGTAADVADEDYVVIVGQGVGSNTSDSTVGAAMHGLMSLVDDGTFRTVLHNITRDAAAERWISTIIGAANPDAAGIELDEGAGVGDNSERYEYLMRVADEIARLSGNEMPDICLTNHAGKRLVVNLVDPDVQQKPLNLKAGYKTVGISLGASPMTLIEDKDCFGGFTSNDSTGNVGRPTRTQFWFLNSDAFRLIETGPPEPVDIGGGAFYRDYAGRTPVANMDLRYEFNVVNEKPWRSGALFDVNVRTLPN